MRIDQKIFILFIIIASLLFSAGNQDIQEKSEVVNVEVQVRVYQDDRFIEDLEIKDFEVYEDGRLQKIKAVYLIRNKKIVKEAAAGEFRIPQVAQTYILAFILTDYLPKVQESLDFFFDRIFKRGDSLAITTPLKTYNLKNESTARMSKSKIKSQLIRLLKKDIRFGNREYKEVIEDLLGAAGNPAKYNILMQRLRMLRFIHEGNLKAIAESLKDIEGQKNLFLFYQKEMVPALKQTTISGTELPNDLLNTLMPGVNTLTSHFDYMETPFDYNLMKRLFSDSSISIHFLYITKEIAELRNLSMSNFVEKSQDIFQVFYDMADATGGYRESTANISSAFKKAADASENYYLLYYAPADRTSDGRFRQIKVRIPGRHCRIYHRSGYFN